MWRVLVICLGIYVLLRILGKVELVVIAVFIGLVITAIIHPVVGLYNRFMPHGVAVALGLITLLAIVGGVFYFITSSVAGEWGTLSQQFSSGIVQIENWLESSFNVHATDFAQWYENARQWVLDNRGTLVKNAAGSAGTLLDVFGGLALAIFTAVCFTGGGGGIWDWMLRMVPRRGRSRVDGAGHVAWTSFAGYTRGIIMVAAANAIFVTILLLVLRVPLAVPLALLVFFGSFIPLIGAPVAMVVSVVVALAARGPIIAVVVLLGIFLLGQLEGHVLQPLVMSKAVHIHPLAVALSVACGALLAGLFGAVIAVPVVSVIYSVAKFWVQSAPLEQTPDLAVAGVGPPVDMADLDSTTSD